LENDKGHTALVSSLGFLILLVIAFSTPSFAERYFSFEKVVDINKGDLEKSVTNLENLPNIFPDNVRSVKPYSDKSAQIVFGIGAFSATSDVKITKELERNIVKIISGDLKDTHLVITTQETWGFDGTPNQGTIVNIDMVLQTSGFLALAGFVSDEAIIYSIDKSLLDLESFVKKPAKQPNQSLADIKVELKTNKRNFRN
jgi:hypothetical protein